MVQSVLPERETEGRGLAALVRMRGLVAEREARRLTQKARYRRNATVDFAGLTEVMAQLIREGLERNGFALQPITAHRYRMVPSEQRTFETD
jgi:hypothetical protein